MIKAQFMESHGITQSDLDSNPNKSDESDTASQSGLQIPTVKRQPGPGEFTDRSLEPFKRPALLPTPESYKRPENEWEYGGKLQRPLTNRNHRPPHHRPHHQTDEVPNFSMSNPRIWQLPIPLPDITRPPPQFNHGAFKPPPPLSSKRSYPPIPPFNAPPPKPPPNERLSTPETLAEGENAAAIHPQQPNITTPIAEKPPSPPETVVRAASPTPSEVSSASSGAKLIVAELYPRRVGSPISPGPFRRTPTPTSSFCNSTTSVDTEPRDEKDGFTKNQRKKYRKRARKEKKEEDMRNGREMTNEEIIKDRHEYLKRCETKKARHTQRRKLQRKNALLALLASASNFEYKARKAEQKAAQIKQQEDQDQRLRDQARVDHAHNLLKAAYKRQEYQEEME
ncbi:MAG: hypothetical protein VX367_12910, partial [SAR324 cluster bacterium]|nr:hypothetical protein [SAR324 cluster bacterium]